MSQNKENLIDNQVGWDYITTPTAISSEQNLTELNYYLQSFWPLSQIHFQLEHNYSLKFKQTSHLSDKTCEKVIAR